MAHAGASKCALTPFTGDSPRRRNQSGGHMSRTRSTPTGVLTLSLMALLACHDNPASPDTFSIQPAPTMSGEGQRDTVLASLAPLRVLVLKNGRPAIGVR